MSTEDDRPRQSGGYADSGYFTPSGSKHPATPTSGDDAYGSAATTALPRPTDSDHDSGRAGREEVLDPEPHTWHFGADLGLFVLRVTLGALFVGHGLQKVFGLLEGPGIGGFAKVLAGFGFQQTTLLSWVTGVTELGAGALLILGLFTPAAAAGVLGVMVNAIWVRVDIDLFAGDVELEAIYAAAAFALLFAGAGRISLDRNTPWFRRAPAFGFIFLILAAGLSVVTLVVLR
ncbi:putative oxidoreductase [Actinokineospora baliensis]|uniref:DoxX family protein n=1 Tax=Actinokineospora baliensis TaxID=547056 RepID=UPI001957CD41|nr:DoxX family protein [Actinokineospora baliensis]MBM7772747.1 putative oxidoreductase [Actinokineospora baliensis]